MRGNTATDTAAAVLRHNIGELRQCLLHVWHGLDQSLIDNTVDQWPTRLRACVRSSNDGHFQRSLPCDCVKVRNVTVSFSQGSVSTLFR